MAALLYGGDEPIDERDLLAAVADLVWALAEEVGAARLPAVAADVVLQGYAVDLELDG